MSLMRFKLQRVENTTHTISSADPRYASVAAPPALVRVFGVPDDGPPPAVASLRFADLLNALDLTLNKVHALRTTASQLQNTSSKTHRRPRIVAAEWAASLAPVSSISRRLKRALCWARYLHLKPLLWTF